MGSPNYCYKGFFEKYWEQNNLNYTIDNYDDDSIEIMEKQYSEYKNPDRRIECINWGKATNSFLKDIWEYGDMINASVGSFEMLDDFLGIEDPNEEKMWTGISYMYTEYLKVYKKFLLII